MEKKLELREASTRRKILALKQQLQSSSKPPATAPERQSTSTLATMSKGIPPSKSDQTMLSSSRVQNIQSDSDPSKRTKLPVTSPIEISKESPTPVINRLTPSEGIAATDSQNVTLNKQEAKLCKKTAADKDSSSPPQAPDIDPVTTTPSTKPDTPDSRSRQKLTLPEEIKETEYMSALQRQKARVSRIRRCIVAATVIQRAWRDYNNKKGIKTIGRLRACNYNTILYT